MRDWLKNLRIEQNLSQQTVAEELKKKEEEEAPAEEATLLSH